jgi:hypothetical protein
MDQPEVTPQEDLNTTEAADQKVQGSGQDTSAVKEIIPKLVLEKSELEEAWNRLIIENQRTVEIEQLKGVLPYTYTNQETGQKMIAIPDRLKTHDIDSTVWNILLALCYRVDVGVLVYKSDLNCSIHQGSDDLWYGIQIGCFDRKPTNFSRSKKQLELGRAYVAAMRVKSFAETNKMVGLLKKDNFFFGNYPKETESEGKNIKQVSYRCKIDIITSFVDKDVGEAIYSILYKLLTLYQFEDYSSEDAETQIRKGFISFEEAIPNFYQTVREPKQKKGQRGRIIMVRKGQKPTSNACLLNEEMALIDQIISPLWSSLEVARETWWPSVIDGSANKLIEEIGKIFSLRYELLAKFASVTTKRLQAIRKIANNTKLSKRNITRDNVSALLSERVRHDSLVQDFMDELKTICGRDVAHLFNIFKLSHQGCEDIKSELVVLTSIISMYRRMSILQIDDKVQKTHPLSEYENSLLVNADKLLKDFSAVRSRCVAVKTTVERISSAMTKELRGFCYQKLLGLIKGLLPKEKWSFVNNRNNYELLTVVLTISGLDLHQSNFTELFDVLQTISDVLIKYGANEKRTLSDGDDASVKSEIKKNWERPLVANQVFFKKLSN